MAEIRPFRGLHYAETDLSALVCPPFDVISPAEQRRLYERSPFNVVRLEYGETRPDDTASKNRYTRAAATLREWLRAAHSRARPAPALYVDDQVFEHEGRRSDATLVCSPASGCTTGTKGRSGRTSTR